MSAITSTVPSAATVDVPLQSLYQQNGIDFADIEIPAIIPPGCSVVFGLYDAQGRFQQFQTIPSGGVSLLAGAPSSVPLVMRMTGNVVIDLGTSAAGTAPVTGQATANAAKQAGTLTAETKVFSVPGSTPFTRVTRDTYLTGFIPGTHSYTEQLEAGPSYASPKAPDAVPTPVLQPDGSYLLHFAWTLSSAVTSCKILLTGTTSDTTKVFSEPKATIALAA